MDIHLKFDDVMLLEIKFRFANLITFFFIRLIYVDTPLISQRFSSIILVLHLCEMQDVREHLLAIIQFRDYLSIPLWKKQNLI